MVFIQWLSLESRLSSMFFPFLIIQDFIVNQTWLPIFYFGGLLFYFLVKDYLEHKELMNRNRH